MAAPPSIADHDGLVNDVSRQLASSRLSRRMSRASSIQSGSQSRHVAAARVEKPRSTHNSPRAVDRRRTTTMASKRYTTLEDHWNMMFGGSTNDDSPEGTDARPVHRPVSWHPGSYHVADVVQSPMESHVDRSYSDWISRPARRGQDAHVSLDSLQAQIQHLGYCSSNVTPAIDSYTTSPSWDNISRSMQGAPLDHTSYPQLNSQPAPWSVPDWVQMTQSTTQSTSQSSSLDFIPIQQPDPETIQQEPDLTSEAGDSIDSDKVLVGMGLYDPPDGYDSWFASGPHVSTGKGLKLEETWEPPEAVSDDGVDDDEDDRSSTSSDVVHIERPSSKPSEDAIMNLDPPTKPTQPQSTLHPSKDLTPKTLRQVRHFPISMAGRSFFFDEDETYTNEWWYHQLKQPSAQDAGIGYGWL